ncbi:hypothetical protein [Chitinophaga sp. CF418]|uniref:hypothetical protein n=1 Tax=Chitinophaga sp. CF418 TaxID=1855287 RepID=UPI00091AE3F6|nr:hypothetical protein [Chitinophaga sp. CF418]SHN45564.1 hypothetical protein SAMN05216311_120110 [Chitinophaga sp. CF418]
MSIKIVNKDVLRHVASKMYLASRNNIVNDNFYECCLKLSETAIEQYVTRWEILNYRTYVSHWADRENISPGEFPKCQVTFLDLVTFNIPAAQFLKWLLFIREGINVDCIIRAGNPIYAVDEDAVKFLNKLIAQVQMAIINELPDFQKAKVNEVPPL